MKVLFLSTTFPTPARPQQGTFNHHMIEALRARHSVRVIAPVPWTQRRLSDFFSHDKESNRSTANNQNVHPTYWYPPKIMRHRYDRFYEASIRSTIAAMKKTFVPEIVMGYWLHPDGAAAIQVAEQVGCPCIVMSGGSDLKELTKQPNRRHAIERVLLRTDHLVVVSQDLARVANALGMPKDRIDVVRRGIDPIRFFAADQDVAREAIGLSRDAVLIMWSGRLEPVKNPLMVIHAAATWKQRWGTRFQLRIAGDGSMRREIETLINQLQCGDCIRLEGNLSQHELAQRYHAADLMVLTSHSEGVPNVLLEAMACGLDFVATDVGGISEIATSGRDRLVPDNDCEAIQKAVIEYVERRETDCSKRVPRTYTPDRLDQMADRFESVFNRLVPR